MTVKKLCRSTFLSIFNIGGGKIDFDSNILIYSSINHISRLKELHENEQKTNFQKPRFLAENRSKT